MKTDKKNRPHSKKIAQLIARHLKLGEKGKALFQRSGAALDEALAFGAPTDEPIKLRDGRQFMLVDKFATSARAFKASMFSRYEVKEYKEPKKPKAAPATETAAGEAPAEVAA
jgi:hypothetical protein